MGSWPLGDARLAQYILWQEVTQKWEESSNRGGKKTCGMVALSCSGLPARERHFHGTSSCHAPADDLTTPECVTCQQRTSSLSHLSRHENSLVIQMQTKEWKQARKYIPSPLDSKNNFIPFHFLRSAFRGWRTHLGHHDPSELPTKDEALWVL